MPFEEKLFKDLDRIGYIISKEKRWNGGYDLPKIIEK